MTSTDVLVVGAGPAGLATSQALSRKGVRHLVLERGDQVGYTWANLYDSLVLHTARRLSSLPGLNFPAGTPMFPTRRDVVSYLHQYAEAFKVPIATGADVRSLVRAGDTWTARTSAGAEYHAGIVVIATGIVANPTTPDIPHRARFGGQVIHSVEYRRPGSFAGKRVLVVGAGNSAADIAVELARGAAHVTLAVRSGAAIMPLTIAGIPVQYLALVVSMLPPKTQHALSGMTAKVAAIFKGAPALAPPRFGDCPRVPQIGFHLADALRAGAIRLKGGLVEFTDDGARFDDDSRESFDAVVLATGYRAAVGILGDAIRLDACGFGQRRDYVVSTDHPDLYFVGHNYGLRGGLLNIGRDARFAARRIAAALYSVA